MASRTVLVATAIVGLAIATFAGKASAHDEPVAGSLIGAGIGAAIAGPPGAAVGAFIGAAIGSNIAHETDHGRHARRDHRHYSRAHVDRVRSERAVYIAPARYVEPVPSAVPRTRPVSDMLTFSEHARYVPAARYNGNGSSTHCEPQQPVKKVSAKPKLKKVCRYVAAK